MLVRRVIKMIHSMKAWKTEGHYRGADIELQVPHLGTHILGRIQLGCSHIRLIQCMEGMVF